ncbi:hypothetical protein [Dyadobacter diqingensis]|uniref:hypothetical protein n=1 Tax=Dyadobacter diqingensis TaxID=2938121 RepID=UPI0020C1B5AC|nr:hypothetical protein [Dyadobacter diqingensis]
MDQNFSVEAAKVAYGKLLAKGNTKPGAAAKSEKTNSRKLRWSEIRTMQTGIDLFQTSIPFSLEEELYLKIEGTFCEYHVCTALIVSRIDEEYHFEVFSQFIDEESADENLDYSFNRVEITEDIFGNLIDAYYYKNKKVGILTRNESEGDVTKEFEWYKRSEKDDVLDGEAFILLYKEKLFFKWLADGQSGPRIQKFGSAFGSVWFRDPDIAFKSEDPE